MDALIAALASGAIGIVTAGAALVVAMINAKKQKIENAANATEIDNLKKTIENANGVYYIICPECGARIYLTAAGLKKE